VIVIRDASVMLVISEDTQQFVREHRIARLATVGSERQPAVVPICYAFDGQRIYTPIDEKAKSVDDRSLRRVRNVESNPRVALVIDDYSEDWSKLAYVLISGIAEIVDPTDIEHARAVELLRSKYPQYRTMAIEQRILIKITPTKIKRWGVGS
jgi:PPOX class probable F420-dependent enzyme